MFGPNSENQEVIGLSFFSQPDGPVTGNGNFESSTLVPGKKASFYVAPPTKDKLSKNFPEGSVLVGAISYGKVSLVGENLEKKPASYMLSFIVPAFKRDKYKGKEKLILSRADLKGRRKRYLTKR